MSIESNANRIKMKTRIITIFPDCLFPYFHFQLPSIVPSYRPFLGLMVTLGLFLFILIRYCENQPFTSPLNEKINKLTTLNKVAPRLEINLSNDSENIKAIEKDKTPSLLRFVKNGWVRSDLILMSQTRSRKPLWPNESDTDRIFEQLTFVPPNLNQITNNGRKLKKILVYNNFFKFKPLKLGQKTFFKNNCPVSSCKITTRRKEAAVADAIVFEDYFFPPKHQRFPSQVWIMYLQESPVRSQKFGNNVFNWTATYRHDSDVVAPYGKFVPYDVSVKSSLSQRNFALNKSGKVAWFVSNCRANNNRLIYAHQLSRYIEVDIYGYCGTKSCPRSQKNKCLKLLDRKYKFYLSFENSNCKDYITEKFFLNALSRDVVPVVMGAPKEDYLRVAPPNSFIFVDDFNTVEDLANYLKLLDENDTLYNQYFVWKGTGVILNSPVYFWCRLCTMLHVPRTTKQYDNFKMWWNGPGICL